MPGIVIETSRLRLRALRDDDLADLVGMAGDWAVACWLAQMPHPYTEVDGRAWIERVQQDHETGRPVRFAIALKSGDRLIGCAGLDGSTGDGSAEPALGYWLGRAHWGRGFGREAVAAVLDHGLNRLALSVIRAYTDPANAASQKLLLACGLERRGEIDLLHPTRHGAARAPLFRIVRRAGAEATEAPSIRSTDRVSIEPQCATKASGRTFDG
jgi:RimJ/RimL family protein N-acetyltransferase